MFSFSKTPRIFSELTNKSSYDTSNIYRQIIKDSFLKCYLCGESQGVARSQRVEHFIPHESGKHINLKYDWNNLLFSCDHCNNRKSSTYNKIGENKDILNPINDNIEDEIRHYYDIDILSNNPITFRNLLGTHKATNTIELLEKIYNDDLNEDKDFAKAAKCRILKNNIVDEIFDFRRLVKKFINIPSSNYESDVILEELKNHLINKSNFYEFKLGFIEENPYIKQLLIKKGVI